MKRLLGLFALALSLGTVLFGQTTGLNGNVVDPSGAVIPNVAITLTNTQTGLERSTTSDAQGHYTMNELTPGTYKLSAKSVGFAEVIIANIELRVNEPA